MSYEITPEQRAKWAEQRRIYDEQGNSPLSKCVMDIESARFVIRHSGEVVYSDSIVCGYSDQVATILSGKQAAWKTVAMFRTLRAAVREATVQMMDVEFPPEHSSRKRVAEFLTVARHFDKLHHGGATF